MSAIVTKAAKAASKVRFKVPRQGGYFAKHAGECAHRVSLDSAPNLYPISLQEPDSEFLQALFDSGNQFEDRIFAEIVAKSVPGTVALLSEVLSPEGERTKEGRELLEEQTLAAVLDPSIEVILGGRIGPVFEKGWTGLFGPAKEVDKKRVSQPDIIVVRRGDSPADIRLDPVDVKDHKALSSAKKKSDYSVSSLGLLAQSAVEQLSGAPKTEDLLQLAHYYRHFQSLGLASSTALGAIIGRELCGIWSDLDSALLADPAASRSKISPLDLYDRLFLLGSKVAVSAMEFNASVSGGFATFPEFKQACKECPWRKICDDELSEAGGGSGHITLLPGITPPRAAAHYIAGVTTVRELARLDLPTAAALEAGTLSSMSSPDAATSLYEGTAAASGLQKDIMQARTHMVQRVTRAPGVDVVDLHRADVEIDFDLENSNGPVSPTSSDHGQLVYMWGIRETRTSRTADSVTVTTVKKHFSDFTDTPAGERSAFIQFWKYLTSSRKRTVASGKSWRAFHYTAHEINWIKKLAERHAGFKGVPNLAEIETFLATGDVVDLYPIFSKDLFWPTRTHSIKDIAKYAKFSWRALDAGGDNSIMWYNRAVCDPNPATRRDFQRKVIEYNEDDTRAQLWVRDFLSNLEESEDPQARLPEARKLRKPRALPSK